MSVNMVNKADRDALEEALIQAAYFQIAGEKSLTVQTVGPWGSVRALVPVHWRAEATERAQPYINALREVFATPPPNPMAYAESD
jgi:hypothetical protein